MKLRKLIRRLAKLDKKSTKSDKQWAKFQRSGGLMYPYDLDNEFGSGVTSTVLDFSVGQQIFKHGEPGRVIGFPFLDYIRVKFDTDGREETYKPGALTTR